MITVDTYVNERECEFKGEKYIVRDNGAVMRLSKKNYRKRKLDNKWTFGVGDKTTGYLKFSSIPIHRIIATAFLGSPKDSNYVVDHINTNRQDNTPGNLRWVTRFENVFLNPITCRNLDHEFHSALADVVGELTLDGGVLLALLCGELEGGDFEVGPLVRLVELGRLVVEHLLVVVRQVVAGIAAGDVLDRQAVLHRRRGRTGIDLDPGVVLRVLVVPLRQCLPDGGLAVKTDGAGIGPCPCLALESVALQEGSLKAVHEVEVAHDGVGVGALAGDHDPSDARVLEEDDGVLLTLRALQGRDGAVVVEAIATDGGELASPATCHEANGRLGRALDELGQLAGILGEGAVVEEAFAVELVDERQAFAEGGLVDGGVDLAVVHQEADVADGARVDVGVEVTVDEGVEEEALDVVAPADDRTGQGNLVGLAVSVRILRLDGLEHRVELIDGGRGLQAQLVEEGLVDKELCLVRAVVAALEAGQRVDVAVDVGHVADAAGELLECLHQVGHPLLRVVLVQRKEEPFLGAVVGLLVKADAKAKEGVGVVAAGEYQCELLSGRLLGDHDEVHLHTGHLLHVLGEAVGVVVFDARGLGHHDVDGDGALYDRIGPEWGILDLRRGRGGLRPLGQESGRHQEGDDQYDQCCLSHSIPPNNLSCRAAGTS